MQNPNEPFWSIKRQKAYKVSRILWIVQIVIALLASVALVVFILIG
ncbi:hypothetical protein R83H12_02603 [Fibrobacteria bacterium R8-3-H12]